MIRPTVLVAVSILAVPLAHAGETGAWQKRPVPWKAGHLGLTTVTLKGCQAVKEKELLVDWPAGDHITVAGIPFDLPGGPLALATSRRGEETIEIEVSGEASEYLLLVAADFPATEPLGVGGTAEQGLPLVCLSETERMSIELLYDDGQRDEMLPVSMVKNRFAVYRGIDVYAVRPLSGKPVKKLLLHDRMASAAFAVLGLSVNRGEPKVAEPELQKIWYPPVTKPALAEAEFDFDTTHGLAWGKIGSPMLAGGIDLTGSPVFRLILGQRELPSTDWKLERAGWQGDTFAAELVYDERPLRLRAAFQARRALPSGVVCSLKLDNAGKAPVAATLRFPEMNAITISNCHDTWYFSGRVGGVINRINGSWQDPIGESHPLGLDGFFNPALGVGLSLMPRDTGELFRWYLLAKDDRGCRYALEYLPQTVQAGGSWDSAAVALTVVPGDWKDQFRQYRQYTSSWYKPMSPRKQWFRELFAFPTYAPDVELKWMEEVERCRQTLGACDYLHLFGWAKTEQFGAWGDYSHFFRYGDDEADGKRRFIEAVRRCQAAGTPVGLYLDGYLVSMAARDIPAALRERWAIRGEDGKPGVYYGSARSMCPYVAEWREYLVDVYRRVAEEIRPDGLYIDEFGQNSFPRSCYSTEHGHPSPVGMSPGESQLTRQIRAAVAPEIAIYSEYVPADVASQYQDGAFSQAFFRGYRGRTEAHRYVAEQSYDIYAPHYVNLQRFAFPDFKTFHIIYSTPLANGNWFLLKYPFFSGDAYYLKGSRYSIDARAAAFYQKVFALQHAHKDAFTSLDVEPLCETATPNLFVNRFTTPAKTVWTLFNANYRTLRGGLMTVAHRDGDTYFDAWNGRPLRAVVRGDRAELTLEIGPRGLGCVVQER